MIEHLLSLDAFRFGLSLLDGFSHPISVDESAALLRQGIEGRAGVLVDGPDDPSVQSRLDELGFRPPENDGRYVIVERYL